MKRTLTAIVLYLMLVSPAWAGFNEGLAAYTRGDYAMALREWRPLAKQGDAQAQYNLGVMYDKGQGVPQDNGEAVKWYHKAAEQGHARAQAALGAMIALGLGVSQDNSLAYMWLSLAVANGEKTAARYRDIVARRLTPTQRAKVEKLAREWLAEYRKHN